MESCIKISSSVIESIITIAINETKNVYQPSKLLDKVKHKFINVVQEDEDLYLEICVEVDYGMFIPDVVKLLQEEIKTSVEIMTNLNVVKIDVLVIGLKIDCKK